MSVVSVATVIMAAKPDGQGSSLGTDFIWEYFTLHSRKEESNKSLDDVQCKFCENITVSVFKPTTNHRES
jgi:hypothetical protein